MIPRPTQWLDAALLKHFKGNEIVHRPPVDLTKMFLISESFSLLETRNVSGQIPSIFSAS